MSDLSGTCTHGISRAKPCGECMGEGFQRLIDAMDDPSTHGGVRGGYAQLFGKINQLTARIEELQRREAMLVDAINESSAYVRMNDNGSGSAFDVLVKNKTALSATSTDSTAWLEQKHVEWMKVLPVTGYMNPSVDKAISMSDFKTQPDWVQTEWEKGTKLYALPTKEIAG